MKKSEIENMLVTLVNTTGVRWVEDVWTREGRYAVDVKAIQQFLKWLKSQSEQEEE